MCRLYRLELHSTPTPESVLRLRLRLRSDSDSGKMWSRGAISTPTPSYFGVNSAPTPAQSGVEESTPTPGPESTPESVISAQTNIIFKEDVGTKESRD